MNPRYAAIAVLGVLSHFHGTLPAAAVVIALIAAACGVLAVPTVRELHRFTSCPHPRAITAGGR